MDSRRIYKARTSLVAQMAKNLPTMSETQVGSLGQEDPLEKGMATHSSILAWKIPWTEEPGGLQSILSQKSRTWLSDWNASPLPLFSQNSHRQYVNEWAGLCTNKFLFTKSGRGLDLASKSQFAHPCFEKWKVLVAQLCPTFCNPIDCSPPGSSVHGIS